MTILSEYVEIRVNKILLQIGLIVSTYVPVFTDVPDCCLPIIYWECSFERMMHYICLQIYNLSVIAVRTGPSILLFIRNSTDTK